MVDSERVPKANDRTCGRKKYVSASNALSPPVDPTLQPGLRSSKCRYENVVTAATSVTESFAATVSGMYVHCRKQCLKLSYG